MKTLRLLLKHNGEVSHTKRSPFAEVLSVSGKSVVARNARGEVFHADLTEKKMALVNHDFWQQVPVDLWEVADVEVPDWVEASELLNSTSLQVGLKWLEGFGADLDWPETTLRWLMSQDEARKLAVVTLLKTKNFRSNFRQSLRDQLDKWLQNPESGYASPFSPRQWECLVTARVRRQADATSRSLYWNR